MKKIKQQLLTKSIGWYINLLSFVNPNKALKLAYQFFSQPRVGKLSKENLPQFLQESHQEIFSLEQHHFHTYVWNGNEITTLLVHGWESNASRWEKLFPYLKKTGNTIVAIDAPAHGLSSGKEFNVPKYAEFIDILIQKYQPKYIIGHSLGGIAVAYYQNYYKNHSLEKMVLLGSPSDFKIILNNYIKLLGLNNKVHQLLIDYTKKRFNITIDEFCATNFLKNTMLKGIVAHDQNDNVVAYSESEKIISSWKNATYITTKGLGHSLHDVDLYLKISAFLV